MPETRLGGMSSLFLERRECCTLKVLVFALLLRLFGKSSVWRLEIYCYGDLEDSVRELVFKEEAVGKERKSFNQNRDLICIFLVVVVDLLLK